MLPVILNGCEAWCHIKECRLRVFANEVLKKIFGSQRKEIREL
jgi:hypothetical protein